MNQLNAAILLYLLSSTISSFCQSSYNGIVKDSLTNEPVPYVHLIFGDKQAAISDENGAFQIPTKVTSITFSAIGYEEKKIFSIFRDSVVHLYPKTYALSETIITPRKIIQINFGTIKKGRVRHSFFSQGEGYQVAKYIPNERHTEGFLSSISFYLTDKTKQVQKIRLILIAHDSVSQQPINSLLPISKIIELGKRKGWVEIDISELKIPYPKIGFYAGIEFLKMNKKVDISNQLSFGLFPFEKEELTWIKFLGSEWNIPPFLNHQEDGQLNLMVKVKVDKFVE